MVRWDVSGWVMEGLLGQFPQHPLNSFAHSCYAMGVGRTGWRDRPSGTVQASGRLSACGVAGRARR